MNHDEVGDDPDYREYTREELPYDALIRLDHAGEWVAWNHELTRAVAWGKDRAAVRAEAIRAGFEGPVMEWVRPLAEPILGNGE